MQKARAKDFTLTVDARRALRSVIRTHPDAAKFVRSSNAISDMKKAELIELALNLGINVHAVIEQAKADPDAAWKAEWTAIKDKYAFQGQIEFDLEMSLLGMKIMRKARLVYSATPDWAYFDRNSGKERLGSETSEWAFEVLAIPDRELLETTASGRIVKRKNGPTWTQVDIFGEGVLPVELLEEFDRLMDEGCRHQDAQNRGNSAEALPQT